MRRTSAQMISGAEDSGAAAVDGRVVNSDRAHHVTSCRIRASRRGHLYGPTYGARSRAYAPRQRTINRQPVRPEGPNQAQLCADQPTELAVIADVQAELQLTPEQRPLFEDLRGAEAQAIEMLKTACPSLIPPAATGRLDAMAQWLDRLLDAVRAVRSPLETFYGALSDEQKARFLVTTGGWRDATGRWLAKCRSEPRGWVSASVEGIERELNLNAAQLAALEELSLASDQATEAVRGSCPKEIPLTPGGRIAAVETRLAALARAAHTLRPALERFYAVLSEDQKERFNALGASTRRHAG